VLGQTPGTGNILYVDQNVGTAGDGRSWDNAIAELADALKWAQENDNHWTAENPLKIYVAKGHYQPKFPPTGVTSDDPRNKTFEMANHVLLYGGFDPENDIKDLDDERMLPDPNPMAPSTGTVLTGSDGEVYHVVTAFGET